MRASSWTPTNGPNACSTRPGCAAACGWAPPTTWRWGPARRAGRLPAGASEVELDISIGVTSELYKLLDDNALDVMIGKRRRGDRRGQTLHKEALLWQAKEGLPLDPDAPLPLILLREPSVTRGLALDALARAGRSWQIVCTSTSYAGCQAAARAAWA